MNIKDTLADFQLIGNRVCEFKVQTYPLATDAPADFNLEIDYDLANIDEDENGILGVLQLKIQITAKVKKNKLFKLSLVMEGTFLGNAKKITQEKFKDMLEVNGLATLSHLSRAYIITATSLSGINPAVRLPMINIFALRELKKKRENV